MATLAVFIALGGGAYAVGVARDSVGTKQLKDDAVISAKVENGSLKANDFDKDQLPAGPPGATGPQGVQGLQGPQGEQGVQGEQGLQGVQGIAGSARAYGLVSASGVVKRSKNVVEREQLGQQCGSPASVSTPRSKRARPLSSRRSTSPRPPPATARAWVRPNPTARGAAAETTSGCRPAGSWAIGGQQRRHRHQTGDSVDFNQQPFFFVVP